jgi:hypothetical protein
MIANSISDQFKDDHWVTMHFCKVERYPELSGHWGMHLLGMNYFQEYFILNYEDQRSCNIHGG